MGGSSRLDEQRERRRVGRALRGVQHPRAVRARAGACCAAAMHLVDLAGRHPPVVVARSRRRSAGSSLCTPLPVSALIFSTGASPRKCEPVARPGTSTSARCSASSSSHLLSRTTIGQPGGVDALGQALVLVGHALGRVDDEQRDVGVVDRLQRPDERVVLGALVDRGSCGACRRCRRSGSARPRSRRRCRSRRGSCPACRARPSGRRRSSRLNSVDLPTLGRPTMRDREDPSSVVGRLGRRASARRSARRRQRGDDRVEQVAGAAAVQRADRIRLAEAERHELPDRRSRAGRRRPCWRRAAPGVSVRRSQLGDAARPPR